MCKHRYSYPTLENLTCPFPKLIEEYKDWVDFELDYDKNGICIFHSPDLEFKKDYLLPKLIKLVNFINRINSNSEADKSYHFMEFQIVNCENAFTLTQNLTFTRNLDFRNATFHNPVIFKDTVFDCANFTNVKFGGHTSFTNCTFKQLLFKNTEVKSFSFQNNNIEEFALFDSSKFTAPTALAFNHFKGYTSFKDCLFISKSEEEEVRFTECHFVREVSFNNAIFESTVTFTDDHFEGITEFIDTHFGERFHIGFYGISIGRLLTMKSSKSDNKLFKNTVAFQVKEEDIRGIIVFENVNFLNIFKNQRDHLMSLQSRGKVEIGKGCIKYRLRTPLKKLNISHQNQNLVTELATTFIQFFKNNSGINLGVEIEHQSDTHIEFFYFSDANLEYAQFESMLAKSENEMWQLVKIKEQTVIVKKQDNKLNLREKYLLGTDTIINLAATILKITTRLSVGKISQEELSTLILATPSGSTNFLANNKIDNLNVNQTIILGIGNSQNLKL